MIIHPLGKHVGTVGGGCGEGDVIRTALDVIQTGEPATVHVDLTEDISMQALGVCGGIMDVFVERAEAGGLATGRPRGTPAVRPGFLDALRESMLNRVAGGPGDRRQRRPGGSAGRRLARPPPLGGLELGEQRSRR